MGMFIGKETPLILSSVVIKRVTDIVAREGKVRPSMSSKQKISEDNKTLSLEVSLALKICEENEEVTYVDAEIIGECKFLFPEPLPEGAINDVKFISKFSHPIYQRLASFLQISLNQFGIAVPLTLVLPENADQLIE